MILGSVTSLLGLVIGIICFVKGELWGLVQGMYAGVVFVIICYFILMETDINKKAALAYNKQCPHSIVLLMVKVVPKFETTYK